MGAFYLLSRNMSSRDSIFVRVGVIAALIVCIVQLFPTGDAQGRMVAQQSAGHAGRDGSAVGYAAEAPLVILGQPDMAGAEDRQPASRCPTC